MTQQPSVSIVIPCRNEASALRTVIEGAKAFCTDQRLVFEIIVVDNHSTDGSYDIAVSEGVHVVVENQVGYGLACRAGLAKATGTMVAIVDADQSYNISDIAALLELLNDGCDLAIGSRLRGTIESGAMPILHRYVGVPLLTTVLNLITGYNLSDAHCGLRLARATSIQCLKMKSNGMEFASEMLLLASRHRLRIGEAPITYRRRRGHSKLRTFRDGIRHLLLMLMFVIHQTWEVISSR